MTRREANNLIETYGRVPRRVLTKVEANDQASPVIDKVARKMELLDGTTANVDISAQTYGLTPSAIFSARGGPYKAGEAHIVGEEGPELRVEDHNGHTFTAPETARMLSGGGGRGVRVGDGGGDGDGGGGVSVNVVVQGSVVGDVDRFAEEIAWRAAQQLGGNTGKKA